MNLFEIVAAAGVLGTFFAFFRYVLICTYRLEPDVSRRILSKVLKGECTKYIVRNQYVEPPKLPEIFAALIRMEGCFFYFSREERLLTAGWKGKEDVSSLMFPRWYRKKIEKLLSRSSDDDVVPVNVLNPSGTEKLGDLIKNVKAEVYLPAYQYSDIEQEVIKVVQGDLYKTSMLLHGAPGNGKTQFVKYLAKKYNLPINMMYFMPEYSNIEIASLFANIPSRCIVLLEDFDTYFKGRECLMKNENVRFTFDSIINSLDGVYNDYKGVVFIMTANDLDKIDDSLKKRPSRFKFVREFMPPDEETRYRILGDPEKVAKTEGMSLDEVFMNRG
jgi:hypothetical protein